MWLCGPGTTDARLAGGATALAAVRHARPTPKPAGHKSGPAFFSDNRRQNRHRGLQATAPSRSDTTPTLPNPSISVWRVARTLPPKAVPRRAVVRDHQPRWVGRVLNCGMVARNVMTKPSISI